MFISLDGMAVGEDGRVAVVRVNGYSVDWLYPHGRIVSGPGYPVHRYPVGEAEKVAEVELMMAEAVYATTQTGGGQPTTSQLRRGIPSSARSSLGDLSWPDELPIFRAGGVRISPSYHVWVERMVPADVQPFYEVFDDEGTRLGYVPFPMGARLLGFGRGGGTGLVAYLARTDALGLRWLERYRVAYEGL
jgi:hypothetical protein